MLPSVGVYLLCCSIRDLCIHKAFHLMMQWDELPLTQLPMTHWFSIVYYLRKTCNQDVSQFGIQTNTNMAVLEYERTHSNTNEPMQAPDDNVRNEIELLKISTHWILQIQKIVEKLQATVSTWTAQKYYNRGPKSRVEVRNLDTEVWEWKDTGCFIWNTIYDKH